jgi:hypothetical protein
MANGHHGRHAVAGPAKPVQPLAHCVPDDEVRHGDAGQCTKHEAARQLEVSGVGVQGHGSRETHTRIKHPTELVRARPYITDIISTDDPYGANPEQRQDKAQGEISRRDMVSEAKLDCSGRTYRRAA